jgi:hypothetical protein
MESAAISRTHLPLGELLCAHDFDDKQLKSPIKIDYNKDRQTRQVMAILVMHHYQEQIQ